MNQVMRDHKNNFMLFFQKVFIYRFLSVTITFCLYPKFGLARLGRIVIKPIISNLKLANKFLLYEDFNILVYFNSKLEFHISL